MMWNGSAKDMRKWCKGAYVHVKNGVGLYVVHTNGEGDIKLINKRDGNSFVATDYDIGASCFTGEYNCIG